MPIIVKPLQQALDADLRGRLEKFEPQLRLVPPSKDATLYVAWFNTKPVAAAWSVGSDHERELMGFAIHPATRGRSVLQQLAQNMRTQENAAGRRVLRSEDFTGLDQAPD